MDISRRLKNQVKRWLPVDRYEMLWLNTHEFLPAKPVAGAYCRELSAADMQRLALIKDFGIDAELAEDFNTLGFVGIGIFIDKKLVGLSLFTADDVPARYNRHGTRFNGIELHLPPGTRCLFKAIVLPSYRGQRLHSAMVRYAIDHFGKDTVHTMVTTLATDNKAYLSSCLDQGFERVGKAAELCLFGQSLYLLPKPIDTLSGEKSNDDEGCIVMAKAA